jgi:CPA1 family monovalent cation:H+ antiporter
MTFLTSLANAALFVLVGLEVQSAVRGLNTVGLARGALMVVGISTVIVAVRFGWLFTSPYAIRLLDRRPQQRARRLGGRPRAVLAAAGFRGAVSLAAALAVPHTLDSGALFPDRDLIVFTTAGVIVMTLLAQVPLFPRLVRWARLRGDQETARERRRAEIAATEDAVAVLPVLAARTGANQEITEQLLTEYERRLRVLRAGHDDTSDDGAASWEQQYENLRSAVIAHKHDAVVRMRDIGEIDDEVLRQIQDNLDAEQVTLDRRRLDGPPT